MQKRERGSNWSFEEKTALLNIIENYIKDVEDKKTDGNAVKRKESVWKKVQEEFCVEHGQKELKRIKEAYKRMKDLAKKEVSLYQKELKKTGGGPPPEKLSPITSRILQLIPREFQQINNPFDDDGDMDTMMYDSREAMTQISTSTATCRQEPCLNFDDADAEPTNTESAIIDTESDDLDSDANNKEVETANNKEVETPISRNVGKQSTKKKKRVKYSSSPNVFDVESSIMKLTNEEHHLKLKLMKEEHEAKMNLVRLKTKLTEAKLNNLTSNTPCSNNREFNSDLELLNSE